MNTKESITITGQIYDTIFELLKKTPEGTRWTDLNKMLIESNPDFQLKTVNGCVWKLVEKTPIKYKNLQKECLD